MKPLFRIGSIAGRFRLADRPGKELLLSAFALGATSIITQVILLREFMSVFFGNELVIGVILANWLFLTGTGAFLGRHASTIKNRTLFLIISQLLLSVLPAATVFFLDLMRNVVFPAGSMPGLLQVLFSSFALMLPYCLLTGFLFSFIAGCISEIYGENLIPVVYAVESVGSVAAGLFYNLLLIRYFPTFRALICLMALNLIAASFLALRQNGIIRIGIPAASLALISIPVLFDLDIITRGFLFNGQQVLFFRDTPYGNLTVTSQAGQKNYYENSLF